MINFSRRDRDAQTSDGLKAALTAASYGGAATPTNSTPVTTGTASSTAGNQSGAIARSQMPPRAPVTRESSPAPVATPRENSPPAQPVSSANAAPSPSATPSASE